MTQVGDVVLDLATSPWVLLVLFAFCVIDGFFPPVPSESVVISLAVLSIAGDAPHLALVMAVAAMGAWIGDLIAFGIGRRIPIEGTRLARSSRGAVVFAWADRQLRQRGATFILSARYVPIGRVAVNMTAGSVGFAGRRFAWIAAIGAVAWSGYSALIGLLAGHALSEHPMLGVVAGVAVGLLIGACVDWALGSLVRRSEAEAEQVPANERTSAGTR